MTSLRRTRRICTPGLPLEAEMPNFAQISWYSLTKSDLETFFEHNMRFLFYFDALCIHIKKVEIKGQA